MACQKETTSPFSSFIDHIGQNVCQYLRKQFCEATDAKISPTCEIESKALTPNGAEDFQRIFLALHQSHMVCGKSWSKTLFSFYYDTPDKALLKHNKGLRLRAMALMQDQINRRIANYIKEKMAENEMPAADFIQQLERCIDTTFDNAGISAKGKTKHFAKNGTVRRELEKKLDTLRLDLTPLFEKYQNSPEDLAFLHRLLADFDNMPEQLKEHFYIDCHRINFKIALYYVDQDDGSTKIQFKSSLNGSGKNTRQAIFEFSLDNSKFFATNPEISTAIPLGEDDEIEFEFQRTPCSYDEDNGIYASDPSITEEEVRAGLDFIAAEIVNKTVLDPAALTWDGTSKQRRGFNALKQYEEKNGPIGLFDTPTAQGKPVELLPLDQKYLQKQNGHTFPIQERKNILQ